MKVTLLAFDRLLCGSHIGGDQVAVESAIAKSGPINRMLTAFLALIARRLNATRLRHTVRRIAATYLTWFTLTALDKSSPNRDHDLVICIDGDLVGFLIAAMRLRSKRVVFKLLNYSRALSPTRTRRLVWFVENSLCRVALRLRRKVIAFSCPTETLSEALASTGFPGEARYIPPFGISLPGEVVEKAEARRRLNLPEDWPLLLAFGTAHGGKDYSVIVKAVSRCEGLAVVFAGPLSNDCGNNPLDLAKKYQCKDRVIVRDQFIPEEEVPLYFRACDAVILSFRKTYAASSSVLMEAIGYGVPVIASDSGVVGQLVRQSRAGWTFGVGDAESLTNALQSWLSAARDAKSRTTPAAGVVSDLSWGRIAALYLSLARGDA